MRQVVKREGTALEKKEEAVEVERNLLSLCI